MFYRETAFQETAIGRVPKEWTVKHVRELFQVETGTTPSTARKVDYWENGTVNWLTPADMSKSNGAIYISGGEKRITEKAVRDYNLAIMPKGSLILSTRAPVGYVAVLSEESAFNQGCKGLMPRKSEDVCPEFYYYYLLSKKQILNNLSSGSTFKELSKEMLEKVRVVYPKPKEQHGIVEVLSCVDLAVQKTFEVIAKTERLKKGLMQQLLTKGIGHKEYKDTEIGQIPKEWQVADVDEECMLGTGGTPSRTNPHYFGGRIPWVKSTEVNYEIITRTEESLTELGLENSNAKVYPSGSLVMALYGQGVTRGKCAIFGIDAAVNQACAVLQSKGRVHIPYLFYWLQNSYTKIRNLSQGANQANLNMGIIRSLKFPLPPIYEQQEIAGVLSSIDRKLSIERDGKTKTERIKLGLMDLLLSGKVRVKVD